MSIKVICWVKSEGALQSKLVLERSSTPSHLIEIADLFLDLYAEQSALSGAAFDRLVCTLDDIEIQTRLLVEQASTAFFLLRHRLFTDKGFALYKHEADVKCFIKMVKDEAQTRYLPPPLWVGVKVKKLAPGQGESLGAAAVKTETGQDAVDPPVKKRLRPSNLGNLGNL